MFVQVCADTPLVAHTHPITRARTARASSRLLAIVAAAASACVLVALLPVPTAWAGEAGLMGTLSAVDDLAGGAELESIAATDGVDAADQPTARMLAQNGGKVPVRVRRLRHRASNLRAQAVRSQQAILDAQLARNTANDRYDRAIEVYTAHIIELYKAGDTDRISMLIAARGLGEAVAATQMLLQMAQYDRMLLEEYRAAAAGATEAQAGVDEAMGQMAGATERLNTVQALLAGYERTGAGRGGVADEAGDPAAAEHFFTTGPLPQIGYYGDASSGGLGAVPFPSLGGAPAPPGEMPDNLKPTGQIETGIASWYGPGFDGTATANGETYDMYAMTAAHKSLPFGTWVKVTSSTGQSVFVRINDRGPYVEGRIIDLSYAAANQLGMEGTASISLEIYGAADGTTSAPAAG